MIQKPNNKGLQYKDRYLRTWLFNSIFCPTGSSSHSKDQLTTVVTVLLILPQEIQQVWNHIAQTTCMLGTRDILNPVSRPTESHRAWYLKSHDQLTSLSGSKDGCVSLRFARDFVSAVSLWHKRAVKKSYKKCRFATFTRCLRIATALAHAYNYRSSTFLSWASRT